MSEKKLVFDDKISSGNFSNKKIEKLREFNIEYQGGECFCKKELIDYAKDAHIIYNNGVVDIDQKVMEKLPKLKAVIRRGIGYDNINIVAAANRGIIVSNTPGFCAEEVSTHAVAFILSFVRKIPFWDQYIRKGKWKKICSSTWEGQDSILDENIGIIGFGNIGKKIAAKLTPFGTHNYFFDPYVKSEKKYNAKKVSLAELVKKSKYIVLCCSLTDETKKILDKDQFLAMREDVVIINVSRGQLINEEILIEYLTEDKIRGAALDVFEKEPVDSNNPLLKMDNVILTPHNAFKSCKSDNILEDMSIAEIIRIATGKKPHYRVN